MYISSRRTVLILLILALNLYLILYISKVYNLPFENDTIRLGIVVFFCLVSLFGIFRALLVDKKLDLLVGVFLLYFMYIFTWILIRESFDTSSLITSLLFPLAFLTGYFTFISIHKVEYLEIVKRFQLLMFFIFLILYFYIRLIVNKNDGMVINSIYYQVLLLPFLLVLDKPLIKRIAIILLIAAVIFSMKRTAFIAVVLVLILYIFLTKKISARLNDVVRNAFFILLTSILVLFSIESTLFSGQQNIFDRFATLSEDRGAGRLDIWISMVNGIKSSSFVELLFGHGIYTSSNVTGGNTAHNDFLEMLWSYGIGGLFLYLGIYIVLIRYSLFLKRENYKHANIFILSILLFFIISVSSHLIFVPTYVIYLCLFWSYCICDYKITKLSLWRR